MAERTLRHVNYGHAGAALFDIDSKEWSFGRRFATTTFRQIGIRDGRHLTLSEVVPASHELSHTTSSTRLTAAKHNTEALVRAHPELAPAAHLLPELAVTSATISAASTTYDPLVGSLFSTGSIAHRYDVANSRGTWQNPRRVVATVTGEGGNILRLSFLHTETHGWSDSQGVWLEGDTVRDTESGYWNEEAAPIQQVFFSRSQDRSHLLAVRLPKRTVFFEPIWTSRLQPAAESPYYTLPHSPFYLRPSFSLDIEQSGGSPHADVTFNPDYQLQFAVVDQGQVWSVWDIQHKRGSSDYALSCLVQGPVVEGGDLVGEDGWARILWVGDVNTIMVCGRRSFVVINFQGGAFERLPVPELILAKSGDWILDVQRHPFQSGCIVVLTSTYLYLISVTTSTHVVNTATNEVGAQVMTSWRHYRSADDFTLSMSAQDLGEEEACVLLRSRLDGLTQIYTFHTASMESTAVIASTSATPLELAIDGQDHIIQLAMEPLAFHGGDGGATSLSLGNSYIERGLKFYKLFILRSDMSIHETIVCSTTQLPLDVQDIAWTTVYPRTKRGRNARKIDQLIEDEGPDSVDGPVLKLSTQITPGLQPEPHNTSCRTVDHTLLYSALLQTDKSTIDIPTVTNQLRQLLLENVDVSELPLGTLNEFAGMPIEVSDIDEASASLDSLTIDHDNDDFVKVDHIASESALHLGEEEPPTISSIYDNMLKTWLAPLPKDVPVRVRQRKERLARRIAAEVMLASSRIQQRNLAVKTAIDEPGMSQDSGIAMPAFSSQPFAPSSAHAASETSSQPLPTAPYLQIQSQSQSQPQPQPPAPAPSPPDPLARLRQHLKFRDDEPPTPPATLPPSVTQLLSHWHPHTNPTTYDYLATERANHTSTLDAASQHQLAKARKKKEKRERKQMRENELAKSQTASQVPLPSSQPSGFAPRSSPGLGLGGREFAFTQVPLLGTGIGMQTQGFPGAQSQIEPGRFGGRVDGKKKKKKRVGGF